MKDRPASRVRVSMPVHRQLALTAALLVSCTLPLHAGEITMSSPLDYQVIQRSSKDKGIIPISGTVQGVDLDKAVVEVSLSNGDPGFKWLPCTVDLAKQSFTATLEAPTGAWSSLDVRVISGNEVFARTKVAHVGIGEVFIVAGQSNSANYGEEKQSTATGLVASFNGSRWQLANDPQTGASGTGGSFMPPLGDELAKRFSTPIGFMPCGIGSTSVREWLPADVKFPNPPTLLNRVSHGPDGQWHSNGHAFDMLMKVMKQAGPQGFRAVLWHQGESDANQADPSRTLPGDLYRKHLEAIIRESRRRMGREIPWFVAQASYHVPGDESSPDIRAAQASLWKDGIALEGPDTDALKGELREAGGKGVHFSGKGLREHAVQWVQRIAPWLERELK